MEFNVVKRERDFLRVFGTEAESYLQGQLSQDVEGLSDGESRFSFLLQPSGKVDAWLRVTCSGENEYLLDVDKGYGDLVAARLKRFLLRTDCIIETSKHFLFTEIESCEMRKDFSDCYIVPYSWFDFKFTDYIFTKGELPEGFEFDTGANWDEVRIKAGIPKMGKEIDDSTIPASLGIVDSSVSFTKGCYTGQELVARVDSRKGGTPYRLVKISGASDVAADQRYISKNDEKIGTVTSQVVTGDGFFALGFLKRGVESPTEAQVINDDLEEKNVLVMPLEA